jgi:hypothetical protein
VCPGHKTLMHYFLCSGGTGTGSTKSTPGHVRPNLCFCIRWDMRVMECVPISPGHESSAHYFSCSAGQDTLHQTCVFPCSRGAGTDLTKRTLGHVTPNLCIYIRCDLWVTSCIPVSPGHETLMLYFSCSVGPGVICIKSAPRHITPNLCVCIC